MRGSSAAGYARKGAVAHWDAGFRLGSSVWSGVPQDAQVMLKCHWLQAVVVFAGDVGLGHGDRAQRCVVAAVGNEIAVVVSTTVIMPPPRAGLGPRPMACAAWRERRRRDKV
jgi:hypothetical protein